MTWKQKIRYVLYKRQSRKVEEINYDDAKEILKNNPEAILIDVRSKDEYKEGCLPGAINIPVYDLEKCIKNDDVINIDQIIIVYCQSGFRSKKAMKILKANGYENCYEIEGGLNEIRK